MENITLIESFAEFKDDKLIDRSTLMAILEDVFRSTLKRKYGDDDNFDIIINPDKVNYTEGEGRNSWPVRSVDESWESWLERGGASVSDQGEIGRAHV